MRMKFGIHRGKDLSEVPVDYLRWLHEEADDINDELYAAVEEELAEREEREDEHRCYVSRR